MVLGFAGHYMGIGIVTMVGKSTILFRSPREDQISSGIFVPFSGTIMHHVKMAHLHAQSTLMAKGTIVRLVNSTVRTHATIRMFRTLS